MAAVLQAISRDADNQNVHNIVRGKHWRSGQWRLMKVDNEASMRPGAYVELGHHLPTWGEVTRFRKATYERLKQLSFKDLKGDVGEFLSDREIRDWLKTRDGLVRHIEQRARQHKDVFFTEKEVSFDARARVGRAASKSFRIRRPLYSRSSAFSHTPSELASWQVWHFSGPWEPSAFHCAA